MKAERFAAGHKGCGHPNPFDYTFKQKVMEISSFIVLTGECPLEKKEDANPFASTMLREKTKEKLRKILPQLEYK